MTRRHIAAALMSPQLTSEDICALGFTLIAHGCSIKGETVQDSIDLWHKLHENMRRPVGDSIRRNWDNLRS